MRKTGVDDCQLGLFLPLFFPSMTCLLTSCLFFASSPYCPTEEMMKGISVAIVSGGAMETVVCKRLRALFERAEVALRLIPGSVGE